MLKGSDFMDEKLYFKENLYYLRTTNNLSQLELAKLLGVSRSAITRWEQGVRIPIVDAAVIIAKYFNVSLDELLTEDLSQKGK